MWAANSVIVRWLLGSICLLSAVQPVWCRSGSVLLREAVEVDHSPVLLSDLLPAEAETSTRMISASVVLCQAPQPGSVRILKVEEILRSAAAHPELLSALSIPSRVTIRDSSRLIRHESVRAAIAEFVHAHAWSELPQSARLEWPQSFAEREDRAQLHVIAAAWDQRQQAPQFRLRCTHRSACADFLVHVALPKSELNAWRRRLASPTSSWPTSATSTAASGPVLAQRGKPAMLILQGGGTRVSLPVICSEPGTLHQRIRVFDRKSNHIFYADVVGEGLLYATL